MAVKVIFFEDDFELGALFKQSMDNAGFLTVPCVDLRSKDLLDADIAIGDYRNEIVSFRALEAVCKKNKIPLIAISGGDMDYHPQMRKPFLMEDLQGLIFKVLRDSPPRIRNDKDRGKRIETDSDSESEGGFFKDVVGFFKNKG
ncbi:MAG: hypothetical protein JNM39_02025 [Bdellovibrionaceae bacterium]|nr:hypothetical protein [Pseudobdellovibrionaceae bacterium]